MPANLSPEYKAAEARFRATREPRERLEALREMLRTIPKHKGTEHLQADIKARIKDLTAELETERRAGGHGAPALVVRREGAAQVALLGAPNAGKSLLHARLTGSEAVSAPYPYTTQFPLPGMLPFEDIQFQLVDLPPVATERPVSWLAGALQSADAALLVLDVSDPAVVDVPGSISAALAQRRITLVAQWPRDAAPAPASDDDPFALHLPALLVANKSDAVRDAQAEVAVLRELTGIAYPALCVSAQTGHGLGEIAPWLFAAFRIVRVYTKLPGHPPDTHRPFTVRAGDTVRDVARLVHKDLARSLRYARVWGRSGFEGQQVGPEHALADRDVIELHA